MKVTIYPADDYGCGWHRLIAPASEMKPEPGVEIEVVEQRKRKVPIFLRGDDVVDIRVPEGTDVVVFQRVTHRHLLQAISILRRKGIAVVVDVDDDLHSIHPANPAWKQLKPGGGHPDHSWHHLMHACRDATLVTATTPLLLDRYASHGRGMVLPNYLFEHYYGIEREDNDTVGWPSSMHSHPNDPDAVGNAMRRLEQDGAELRILAHPGGTRRAFGLESDLTGEGPHSLQNWPAAVATLGIGIAPLADTRFNQAKSWLKPLEMSAAGVPWVASPRVEYQRLRDMGCGMLAEKASDWYTRLSLLRKNEVIRKEMSEAGHSVADQLRIRDHSWKYLEAWKHALDLQRGRS